VATFNTWLERDGYEDRRVTQMDYAFTEQV
jgi:hypothetical protein